MAYGAGGYAQIFCDNNKSNNKLCALYGRSERQLEVQAPELHSPLLPYYRSTVPNSDPTNNNIICYQVTTEGVLSIIANPQYDANMKPIDLPGMSGPSTRLGRNFQTTRVGNKEIVR